MSKILNYKSSIEESLSQDDPENFFDFYSHLTKAFLLRNFSPHAENCMEKVPN